MFLLFSVLFAVWYFHHSTFSAQRYDNFQERQKYTLINLLFWREWNLPLAQFLPVENNKTLKDLRTVWMIGCQIWTFYLCSSLFLLFRQSFISVAGCSFQPKPFRIQNEVWLPLHPKTKIGGKRNGLFCEDLYLLFTL